MGEILSAVSLRHILNTKFCLINHVLQGIGVLAWSSGLLIMMRLSRLGTTIRNGQFAI